jgi:hypothetical protein
MGNVPNYTLLLWNQSQGFLDQTLGLLTEENRYFRLTPNSSSAGFWLQHQAETKLMMMQLFHGTEHGYPELVTLNGAHDTGQAGSLAYIHQINADTHKLIADQIATWGNDGLAVTVETFLGPMSRAETTGLMSFHANYHVGQANLALKKGMIV